MTCYALKRAYRNVLRDAECTLTTNRHTVNGAGLNVNSWSRTNDLA